MVEVADFIDQVLAQDFSKAGPTFNDILGDKMNDALEAEKIRVADHIFNGVEDPEDNDQFEMDFDEDDEEFDEEELDDAAEEAMEADEEEDFSDDEE